MQLKHQPNLKTGYNKIIGPENNLNYIEEFGILSLKPGSVFEGSSQNTETALVVLRGSCGVEAGEKNFEKVGQRENLFEGNPATIYIPAGLDFDISGGPCQIAICKAKSSKRGEPVLISPEQVVIKDSGKDNWSREVRIMIGPETISQNLIIGETINPPGNWSGTPPHKHDNEELYYFYCSKPEGWGVERIYSEDRTTDELIKLKDNTVTIMPKEHYHQIVAGPGYTIYYLWFIAGKDNKLNALEDPKHNWIKGE